mmetsp:Transcript_13996/g.43593  ORF Transcript_13996/g.43593 Transcript_13996/m.43593 type:complete len:177 (-) Transcript_13996:11-541(-)
MKAHRAESRPLAASTPQLSMALPIVMVLAEWYGNTDAASQILGPFASREAAEAGIRDFDAHFWKSAGMDRSNRAHRNEIVRFPSMDEAGFSFPRFSVYEYNATVLPASSVGVGDTTTGAAALRLHAATRTNLPPKDDPDVAVDDGDDASVSSFFEMVRDASLPGFSDSENNDHEDA